MKKKISCGQRDGLAVISTKPSFNSHHTHGNSKLSNSSPRAPQALHTWYKDMYIGKTFRKIKKGKNFFQKHFLILQNMLNLPIRNYFKLCLLLFLGSHGHLHGCQHLGKLLNHPRYQHFPGCAFAISIQVKCRHPRVLCACTAWSHNP